MQVMYPYLDPPEVPNKNREGTKPLARLSAGNRVAAFGFRRGNHF